MAYNAIIRVCTILLVDDDASIRELLNRMLSAQGHSVIVASCGKEALELAARHPPPIHLLITDLRMPGMDGAQLWARLSVLRPELKCLFISGYPKGALIREAFLAKPFSAAALFAKIRSLVGDRIESERAAAPRTRQAASG